MSKIAKAAIYCLALISLSFDSICQTTIVMKRKGNVYVLPCNVNGLLLDLIFDTGAEDVSLSSTEASFMLKNGYLYENDINGKESFRTANGEIAEGTKVIIRKITFAGLEINNVEASIMPNQDAPLLFGQSAIRKLGKIELDPANNKLIVFKGKGTYDYSKNDNTDNYANAREAKTGNQPKANASKKTNPNTLNEVMTLHIDRPGGANGANVTWNPIQKRYYAIQAGNAAFPLEIFDAKGKMVSDDNQEALFDVRGFWYNPKAKTFQANGYSDNGWAEYKLDVKGSPVSIKHLFNGRHQPDDQVAGVYDTKNNVVYFYNSSSGALDRYQMNDGTSDSTIVLHLSVKNKEDINDNAQETLAYSYNKYEVIYTGITHAEIGLLDFRDKQIELYNLATGLLTQTLKLPDDAPAEDVMNFSYSNGIYWLFDKNERTWHGYK